MGRRRKKRYRRELIGIVVVVTLVLFSYYVSEIYDESSNIKSFKSIDDIPEYDGNMYIYINNNKPYFIDKDYKTEPFEEYSSLDIYSRCGVAYAHISKELMPTTKRERIVGVKPSGWHLIKYDIIEDGKYLYNRCHLIGYQLTGENSNQRNLITCTRQMNTIGMEGFESKVAEYIKRTNNHVLYRVTPIFKDNELLARGVEIEASSVEDKCGDICFNIFVYNVQDGIEIDYSDGDSKLID